MNERARQRMPLHIFWSQPISSGPRHNDGLTAAGQWRMHALSVTTSDEKYTIVTRSRDRNKASLLAGTPASLPGTAQCLWPLPKAMPGSSTPPCPSMHRSASTIKVPSLPLLSLVVPSTSSPMCPNALHASALVHRDALRLARPHLPSPLRVGQGGKGPSKRSRLSR